MVPRADNSAPDIRFMRGWQQALCPDCGERLVAPEASEFVADGRVVRHRWTCEACGSSFRTAVNFPTLN
jgi:RNase P subunit RPR2